eukprot:g13919.t1
MVWQCYVTPVGSWGVVPSDLAHRQAIRNCNTPQPVRSAKVRRLGHMLKMQSLWVYCSALVACIYFAGASTSPSFKLVAYPEDFFLLTPEKHVEVCQNMNDKYLWEEVGKLEEAIKGVFDSTEQLTGVTEIGTDAGDDVKKSSSKKVEEANLEISRISKIVHNTIHKYKKVCQNVAAGKAKKNCVKFKHAGKMMGKSLKKCENRYKRVMANTKKLVKRTGHSKFDMQCVHPINWANVLKDIKNFLLHSKDCEESNWVGDACHKEIHVFGHSDDGENTAFLQLQETGEAVCTDATTIDLTGYNMFELTGFIPEGLDIKDFTFTARREHDGPSDTVIPSDEFTVTSSGNLNLYLNCQDPGSTKTFCQEIEQCNRDDIHFYVEGTKDGNVELKTNVRIDQTMVVHLTHERNGESTSVSTQGLLGQQPQLRRRRLLVGGIGGFGC